MSILQDEKSCFVCGCTNNLHRHHIMYGTGWRDISEKYDITVWLCQHHHQDHREGVHHCRPLNRQLKKLAQLEFAERYPEKSWVELFGVSYL